MREVLNSPLIFIAARIYKKVFSFKGLSFAKLFFLPCSIDLTGLKYPTTRE
jgi:hypothetical protein